MSLEMSIACRDEQVKEKALAIINSANVEVKINKLLLKCSYSNDLVASLLQSFDSWKCFIADEEGNIFETDQWVGTDMAFGRMSHYPNASLVEKLQAAIRDPDDVYWGSFAKKSSNRSIMDDLAEKCIVSYISGGGFDEHELGLTLHNDLCKMYDSYDADIDLSYDIF